MVRKKRKKIEVVKPWCFYCDREFNQEADLLTHQKSKHFKCPNCTKRLGSARALSIHCLQVHKTGIHEIPEAKEGRKDPKWDIVGSVGIPPGMVRGGPCPPRGSSTTSSNIVPTPAAVRPRVAAYPPPMYGTGGGGPPPPYYYYGPPGGHPRPPPPPLAGPYAPPGPTAAPPPSHVPRPTQQYVSAPSRIHKKPTVSSTLKDDNSRIHDNT